MSLSVANPFVVGGAISDPLGRGFYGRDDIFTFVRGALTARHRPPILLAGQRRIGKSSILRQLPRHLPIDYVCVYYDLQGRAQLTLDEVLYGLGRAVADAVGVSRPAEQESTENTIENFLNRAAAALDGKPERLILLFDEFDVIDQQFVGPEIAARRFIPFLADLISRQPKIGYVLVVGRRAEELSEGFFSSVLKDALQKRIGRLQRRETERLASEAFGEAIARDALQEIFSVTAGHPFCVQVLCYAIWHQKQQDGWSAAVSTADVEAAMPQALELGTLGLNWVYDGLVQSSHRLFLSALAGLAGVGAMDEVAYDTIHEALYARRLGVDEHQFRQAPLDLRNWDVIEGSSVGFRFTVPMIGSWIRANRGLAGLEEETRLINPRASKYQELAAESYERGDYDAAIEDYRNALAANPVFVEAQVGLATALRARNQEGDVAEAVEAFERAFELDPNAARTPVLEALLALMEQQSDILTFTKQYDRIRALDPDGIYRERATRLIEQRARVRLEYGTARYLNEAEVLFEFVGATDLREEARKKHDRVRRVQNIFLGLWFGSTVAWLIASLAETYLPATTPLLQLALAGVSAAFMSTAVASERDGRLTVRRWSPGAGLVTLGLVLFVMTDLRPSVWWGSIITFFVVVVVSGLLNAGPIPPKELMPSRSPRNPRAMRDRIARMLERAAKSLRGNMKSK